MDIIEHNPELYHLTFGQHDHALRIKSGQSIQVRLPDCDGLGPDGKMLPQQKFEQSKDAEMVVGNPVAGPYLIEGAEIGDSLAVHIEEVNIEQNFGRTGISAKQICIPPELFATKDDRNNNIQVPSEVSRWKIDTKNALATLKLHKSKKKSIEVPLNPFAGCIAVAPMNGQFISTLEAGDFGGNFDIPYLGKGTCVYMPVFANGAYLFLGDIHAAQGDGEIIGGAIEVGGNIKFRVEVCKHSPISWPRIETCTHIGTIGTGENLQKAFEVAYAQLIIWLSETHGYDRWEAMHLVSQVVEAHPGNFNSAICKVAKSYL